MYRPIRSINLSSGQLRRIGVLIEHEGFFVSDDDGQNWSAGASDILGTSIRLIVSSQHDYRRMLALTVDRGAFLSDDSGETWAQCAGLPYDDIFVTIAEPDDDADVVFAASLLRNVYRSSNGGRTFSRVGGVDLPTGTDPSKLCWTTLVVRSRPGAPATLVLGSSLGAYLSPNEGRTWESLPAGVLKNNYAVEDLLLSDYGTKILMATNEGLLLRELLP